MHIQWCVKGIAGQSDSSLGTRLTKTEAFDIVTSRKGIISNWWRSLGRISPGQVELVLTEANLDLHLHSYDTYGHQSPFISLSAGFVEWDRRHAAIAVYSAVDTALLFATDGWHHPGALFYCWTSVSTEAAIPIQAVSEPVRDPLVYRRWSPYFDEGEIAAKVSVPANQIQKVEWWDESIRTDGPADTLWNANFVEPGPLTALREYIG